MTNLSANEINFKLGEKVLNFELSSEGTFADTLFIDEGSYWTIGAGRNTTKVFIAPGNNLNFSLDGIKFKEPQAEGLGSEATNYLTKKFLSQEAYKKSFDVMSFYSANEEDYIQNVEDKYDQDLALLKEQKNLSAEFSAMELENIKYSKLMSYMSYEEGHKYFTNKTEFDPSAAITDKLNSIDYDNQSHFINFESYRNLVVNHYSLIARDNERFDELTQKIRNLKSPSIKKAVLNNLSFFVSPSNENLDQVAQLIIEESDDDELKNKVANDYETMKNLAKGKPSPNFEYESADGNQVSLTSLQGKLVYIDVWATWCGPCKREIPYLKEVEAQYHEKGIEFVSLSIDEQKNKQKWKDFVDAQELGGIQLLADNDWTSEFVRSYSITGIPRFILLDQNGNIIDADAPRPSNPALIQLFEEYI
ncbi:MAG: TlpA disulfide reductase family protein [Bacteroidota bacterium]